MNHRMGFKRLGRKASHRKSLYRNMISSLIKHERIRTTITKAKEVRRKAEKIITRAKTDSVNNRRIVSKDIQDKAILAKLFVEIGPRYAERPGGYTRILKLGKRKSDSTEMAFLELVDRKIVVKEKKKKKEKSTGA
ncbi:MAG: 50S ribosomal protein L17 [Spirochaetales bacterium]|nr:50S ribosomal protein L17 [Spirochaetales bacterium]